MLLYHATYRAYLDSILESGLLCEPPHWTWSWAGDYGSTVSAFGPCVFLAKDDDVAESFAEAADEVEDVVFDSGIVILSVDSDDLDPDLLTYDPFYHSDIESEFEDPYFEEIGVLEQATCFAYRGDVPSELLSVVR